MSKTMQLCAPFPDMDIPWSDEKIKELDEALSRYEVDAPMKSLFQEYEIEIGTGPLGVFIPDAWASNFVTEFKKLEAPYSLKRFRMLVKLFDGEII